MNMITNKVILTWAQQIDELKNQDPPHFLVWAVGSAINDFYRQFGKKVDLLNKQIEVMHEKYFVMNGKNIQVKKVDKQMLPMMKSGMIYKDYQVEIKELMDRKVSDLVIVTK